MLYLSGKEGLSSSSEVGEVVGIDKMFVREVLRVLRDAGVVSNIHGGTDGYRLTKKPEEIVLLDIILLLEKMMEISRCPEPKGYCDRYETYPMHVYHKEV